MRLKITHKTNYQYSKKVFVEPHHFYFYPLPRNYLTLLDFELDVFPASSGLAQRVDAEDNLYHQCWFNEMMDHFTVMATIEVQTDEINPFNFLLEEKTKESCPCEHRCASSRRSRQHQILWGQHRFIAGYRSAHDRDGGQNRLLHAQCPQEGVGATGQDHEDQMLQV